MKIKLNRQQVVGVGVIVAILMFFLIGKAYDRYGSYKRHKEVDEMISSEYAMMESVIYMELCVEPGRPAYTKYKLRDGSWHEMDSRKWVMLTERYLAKKKKEEAQTAAEK